MEVKSIAPAPLQPACQHSGQARFCYPALGTPASAGSRRGSTSPADEPLRSEDPLADLTVDLHIERIPEWAALEFQLNYFRQVLRQNLRHKGKRITFIHGVGDGTLATAIRKELDEVFALSCIYTYSTPGITNVTIR